MVSKEELKKNIKELDGKLKGVTASLDLDALKKELEQLNLKINASGFWDEVQVAQKTVQYANGIKNKIEEVERLAANLKGIDELSEICDDENSTLFAETVNEYCILEEQVDAFYISTLLCGKYDNCSAILSLNAGAGGTEAQDWVEMLYRMYTRYCESRNFKVRELDRLIGDFAGIKSVTFTAEGENAYGYLKAERGVHRLVRISPFDPAGKRHTSFASLDVMPEIDNETDIVIEEKDLKIDTFRAGGAGGQHVNKTETAIRITHIPTGIVVACQNERSQLINRDRAMKMLKSKLIEIREREQTEEATALKGSIKKIEWGSQIRSYVFCPYTLVKDHRTGLEVSNISAVMEGDLQAFIEDYLQKTK